MKEYVLGIDTSNYTTSLALIDSDYNVIKDERILLTVKEGSRGLRQSEAYFQHGKNLPLLMEKILSNIDKSAIKAISVSDKPRNIEGSYMPAFLCGIQYGKVVSDLLDIPLFQNSHQEGHIMAIKKYSNLSNQNNFICFHLSGGTTEILEIKNENIKIIGGSKDISFGQLIDRIGVSLEIPFPCGPSLDKMAIDNYFNSPMNTLIKTNNLYFNLSGIETKYQRLIDNYTKEEISFNLFNDISRCLTKLVEEINKKYNNSDIIFVGGVSLSEFIQKNVSSVIYGKYGSDNAIGTAIIGGSKLWL